MRGGICSINLPAKLGAKSAWFAKTPGTAQELPALTIIIIVIMPTISKPKKGMAIKRIPQSIVTRKMDTLRM